MKLKPNTYYLYKYKNSIILTKTFKKENFPTLWANDKLLISGKESLMSNWEFEDIYNSNNVIEILKVVSRETDPEIFI